MSITSLVCQGMRRDQRPITLPCPISHCLLSVAESDAIKSANDRFFLCPVKDLDLELEIKLAREDVEAWQYGLKKGGAA